MGVAIVTDSAADYTLAEARTKGIEIIACWMVYGSQRLRDAVDLKTDEFYARLQTDAVPTTEPASIDEYADVFSKVINAGNDLVCITVSGGISKSYEHAVAAASRFPGKAFVVDSHAAAGAMRLICEYARERAAAGAPASEIAAECDPNKLKLFAHFAVADIKHLGRSGRLPKAMVALGSMLNVSLILKMNEKGEIGPAGQSRSFEKTTELMVDALVRQIKDSPSARVAISHVQAADTAASLATMLEQKLTFRPRVLEIHEATPTISTHQGIGAVGLFAITPP